MEESPKKYKVIILDDDKFLLSMYSLKFQKEGVEVIGVESGEELITKMKEGLTADLMLLDIIISGVDGLTTLDRLQKADLIKNMKVVMLTNQGDPEEMKRAEFLGVEGYIVKATATPSEVVSKVLEILNKNK